MFEQDHLVDIYGELHGHMVQIHNSIGFDARGQFISPLFGHGCHRTIGNLV